MKKKASVVLVLLIAIISVFFTSYCFAESTTILTKLDDQSSIDVSNILSAFSDEYLSMHEDDEVVLVVQYNDSSSHELTEDLALMGIEAQKRYSYSNIFNGQSISIKIKDILSLSSLSYIKSVDIANVYYELSNDGYSYSAESGTIGGIFKNETAYTGKGVVVAVVDAGFDTSHVAFSNTTEVESTLTEAVIKDALYELNSYEQSGVSSQSVYVSKKIAYAYDYGDGDTDVYYSSSSHGTHVAGIIAGDSSTITGVAKDAQLALMKVSNSEGYMYDDTIAAALEDCLKLNVDVVNMSLGSNSGFEVNEDNVIYKAVKALKEAGVSVVCASGNSYTSAYGGANESNLATSEYIDNAAIGAPASYDESISIGNVQELVWFEVDGNKITYTNAINSTTSTYCSFSQDILEYIDAHSLSSTIDYVILKDGDEIAIGKSDDYAGIDVTNKIVVVKRGDISFEEKVQNAKANGAIGVIFVNNSSTTIIPSITSENITAAIVTKDIGKILEDAATNSVGQMVFDSSFKASIMHGSSSSGVTNNLNLGVDVAGYGTSIYSAGNNQTYVQMTGTSMASPNVAGVYAAVYGFVKANKATFNVDTKLEMTTLASALIMSNADLLTDLDGVLISPRSQGAGLASVSDAINSLAYISTSDGYKSKIELGENVTKDITLSLTINNYNAFDITANLNVYVLTELLKDGNMSGNDTALDFVINSVSNSEKIGDVYVISIPSGTNKTIEIDLTLSQEALEILNQFENGIYVEGFVELVDSANSINLSVPFIGFYGDWDAQAMLDITAYEDDDDTDPYMRASTSYGIYANSYYVPLGVFAYELGDDYEGEKPNANEEFAALSIYSSSMYSLGYIQLGLLRNAEYIEVEVVDLLTNDTIYTTDASYVPKTTYYPSYSVLYGGDFTLNISPYSLDLYNNEQYEVIVRVYRTYDKDGNNEASGIYTQKFYVDEEKPEIEKIEASEENGKYLATFTVSDNHYIQALAICTGTGSSISNVTLNVEDIYPIAMEADGVGQTTKVTYDVTDAISKASNGYLYFYICDYAFNTNVYYYSVKNWEGVSSSIGSKESSNETTNSSRPATDTKTIETNTISFIKTEIDVSVNKEVDLANNTYLKNYNPDKKYTWTSSDTSVLAISSGKITGLQEGMAIVYIVDEDNNESSITINVFESSYESATYEKTNISSYEMVETITTNKQPFFGISISASKITLAPGESFRFEYSYSPYNYNYIQNPVTITYETKNSDDTDNDSILEIVDGVIKTKASGEVRLIVKANGTIVNTYNVTVVEKIYVNDDGLLLACFEDTETDLDLSSAAYDNIVAIGANAFSYATSIENVVLPNNCRTIYDNAFYGNTSIKTISNMDSITTIGANAFYGCLRLESIDLTNVQKVSSKAFYYCINLSEVKLASANLSTMNIANDAFLRCAKLTSFTIDGNPSSNIVIGGELKLALNIQGVLADTSIKVIGEGALSNISVSGGVLDLSSTSIERIEINAFKGNTSLRSIKLPSTLTYIGQSAFEDCKNLQTINIKKVDNQELTIASRAFYNTYLSIVDFAGIKTTYKDYVFYMNQRLTMVRLGEVQEMGKYTFAATRVLRSVVFDEGSKDLGTYTFAPITVNSTTYYHKDLVRVEVPDSIEEIGEYVFAYCSALDMSYMDLSNVKKIGDYAFMSCTSLDTLTLPKIEEVGEAAFAQSAIRNITLNKDMASGTLKIRDLAFYECERLEKVELPTSSDVDVEILYGAFYKSFTNEDNKAEINLQQVTKLGDYAFTYCAGLKSVALSNCTEIGYAAFAECTKLSSVSMPVVETIKSLAFYKTAIEELTIPTTLKSIAQATFCETDVNLSLEENGDYTLSNIRFDTKDNQNILYRILDDGTYMLIYYPKTLKLASYDVLDNTSAIGEYAFDGNESLIHVVLPASVKAIGNGAFFGCTNIGFVDYKGTTTPKILGAYNSSSGSIYCNFISYNQDKVSVALLVTNEDMKNAFESNKTWNMLCDEIMLSQDAQKMVDFIVKASALYGQSITDGNKAQFEELSRAYNALSESDKTTLSSLTSGEAALKSYNSQLKEYSSKASIIDNIAVNTGLENWVVVAIVASIAVVLVAGAIIATFMITKKRMELNTIRQSRKENIDLEDIFGSANNQEKKIDLDDVFRDYDNKKVEEEKEDGTNKDSDDTKRGE